MVRLYLDMGDLIDNGNYWLQLIILFQSALPHLLLVIVDCPVDLLRYWLHTLIGDLLPYPRFILPHLRFAFCFADDLLITFVVDCCLPIFPLMDCFLLLLLNYLIPVITPPHSWCLPHHITCWFVLATGGLRLRFWRITPRFVDLPDSCYFITGFVDWLLITPIVAFTFDLLIWTLPDYGSGYLHICPRWLFTLLHCGHRLFVTDITFDWVSRWFITIVYLIDCCSRTIVDSPRLFITSRICTYTWFWFVVVDSYRYVVVIIFPFPFPHRRFLFLFWAFLLRFCVRSRWLLIHTRLPFPLLRCCCCCDYPIYRLPLRFVPLVIPHVGYCFGELCYLLLLVVLWLLLILIIDCLFIWFSWFCVRLFLLFAFCCCLRSFCVLRFALVDCHHTPHHARSWLRWFLPLPLVALRYVDSPPRCCCLITIGWFVVSIFDLIVD